MISSVNNNTAMRKDISKAELEFCCGRSDQLPGSILPEVVFSGRSNVGKSSLINKLLNRKALARVSSSPGKTCTINFYKVGGIRFVDLPGYGYAKVSFSEKDRWAELVQGYFDVPRQLKLVVQLVDMRHPPTRDDLQMLDFLSRMRQTKIVVALTKSDKLNKTQYITRLHDVQTELSGVNIVRIIPVSTVKREGIDELLTMIWDEALTKGSVQ